MENVNKSFVHGKEAKVRQDRINLIKKKKRLNQHFGTVGTMRKKGHLKDTFMYENIEGLDLNL